MKALARMKFTLLGAVLALLSACAVTPVDVYREAETDGQKALATIELARIYTELALAVAADPATAPEVKSALKSANARLRPTVDALFEAYVDYKAALDAWKAGGETYTGKFLVLAANLRGWINAAQTHIDAMKGLVDKWKGAEAAPDPMPAFAAITINVEG